MRKKCYQRIIRDKQAKNIKTYPISKKFLVPKNANVKFISNEEAKKMILLYEWLGTMPSAPQISIGLFFNNILSGVEVFTEIKGGGSKYSLYQEKAVSLSRGCCAWYCPNWCNSFLIGKALKLLTKYYEGIPRYVIAYSDWEAGELGTIYQATNWQYTGEIKSPKWISPTGKAFDHNHHRNLSRKLDKNFKFLKKLNPKIVENTKQNLLNSGWERKNIIRGRYVTVIGYRGKEKTRLIHKLKENSKSYPKSNIRRT